MTWKPLTLSDNQSITVIRCRPVEVDYLGAFVGVEADMKGATVTRADLCEAVHEEVGLTRQDCSELVERTLELATVALERGEQVKLSGFGVFQVRAKNARMGRNPKTGKPATIEPRRVIGFRASQVMKARVDRALAK